MEPGPLTPDLYRRLEDHFGPVIIANHGEEAVVRHQYGLTSSRRVGGESPHAKAIIEHPGEYYRVCCPKCGESRHRLWVNHRAVEFPWLINCYNDQGDCYRNMQARDQLIFQLYKTRRPNKPKVNPGRRDTTRLSRTELPEGTVTLDTLPRSHPANAYLADERGYDPWELGRQYGIGYCASSAQYPKCGNRIVIPIRMNGVLVGWQVRFIGERNWKASAVPKYWDKPGMPKRLMLYNHDVAKTYPWVGLQEGVTDVWSTGPMMMGLLGSTISFAQHRILAFTFGMKPLVMMMDGDAYLANAPVVEDLRRTHRAGVVAVRLPDHVDPGELMPEVNQDLIHEAAREQGVVLPGGAV